METKFSLRGLGYAASDLFFNRRLADHLLDDSKNKDRSKGAEKFVRWVCFIAPEGMRPIKKPLLLYTAVPAGIANTLTVSKIGQEGILMSNYLADKLKMNDLETLGLQIIGFLTFTLGTRIALNIYQNVLIKLFGNNNFSGTLNLGAAVGIEDVLSNGSEKVKAALELIKEIPHILPTLLSN